MARSERWSLPTQTILYAGLVAVVIAVAVYAILWVSPGLLDYDTYGRLRFLPHLRPDLYVDGHLLLHLALHRFIVLGSSPTAAVFGGTALGVGLLVVVATFVARARGLEGRGLVLAVAALLLASPALAALVLMAEDNVLYLAPLLLYYHLLTTTRATRREELRAGGLAALMLAIVMHLNITALIFLFVVGLAPILWRLGRRGDALRLATASFGALALYYLFALVLNAGGPLALHEFLPQALALKDFEQSTTPLFSWARWEQFYGGFRATALTPTIHRMVIADWLAPLITRWVPAALLLAYGIFALRGFRRVELSKEWPARLLIGGLAALTLVFPYLYEPALIERWDMFWLVFWLGLVALIRTHPRAGAEVLLTFVLLVQMAGTGLVAAHHLGRLYERPEETELREDVAALARGDEDPIVLPLEVDRQLLAYLDHRLPRRRVFLIGEDQGELRCLRLLPPLRETPGACLDLAREIEASPDPHIDWQAAPHLATLRARVRERDDRD